MPESPEVREYYNFVKTFLLNKTVTDIKILSGKYQKTNPENWNCLEKRLSNKNKVTDIIVKGKTIFIEIKCKDDFIWLSFTHGMTGYWDTEKIKHSRILFQIENDDVIYYNDIIYYNDTRNFGKMNIYVNEIDYKNAISHLGHDVLDENLTYDQFYSRINTKPRSKIGAVLLDQKLIAGIGNYMRCDILWYAKLHYTRTINSLTAYEVINNE